MGTHLTAFFVLAQGDAASDGDVLAEDMSTNLKPTAVLASVVRFWSKLENQGCQFHCSRYVDEPLHCFHIFILLITSLDLIGPGPKPDRGTDQGPSGSFRQASEPTRGAA